MKLIDKLKQILNFNSSKNKPKDESKFQEHTTNSDKNFKFKYNVNKNDEKLKNTELKKVYEIKYKNKTIDDIDDFVR